jgi:hypothetical protein
MNATNSQQALAVLAQQRLGAVPAVFRDRVGQGKFNEDMSAGITSGFAILSFRGKAWRVKHRGEEMVLTNPDGTPKYKLDVVIVRTSPNLSKVWYKHGYVEGSTAPPDCWSVDGRKPDPASPDIQNATCAGCRWNAWGSSRTQGGSGKGKDCADSKRLAIVPLQDIDNEIHGGPMMLRVPPASLNDLAAYANSLERIGYPYYAVGTSISFDVHAEYPKLMFTPARALTEEEAEKVAEMQKSDLVDRIIPAAVEAVTTDGTDTTHVPPVTQTQHPLSPKPAEPEPVRVYEPTPPPKSERLPHEVNDKSQRENLRAIGLTEEQIIAALGPESKPEPPADPRVAQLKAMGFDDAKIAEILGTAAAPAAQTELKLQPQPESQAAEPAKPGRKPRSPNKPKEAAPPTNGAHKPAAAPPAAAAPVTAPATSQAPGELPAGFDDLLDGIMAETKQ